MLFLLGVMACEAGPPAFEEPARDEGVSSSDLEVEGRTDQDSLTRSVTADRALDDAFLEPVADGGAASDSAATASGASPEPEEPGARVEEWGTDRFPYPGQVKALYLNAWASGSTNRMESLIALAKRTEINSFVIDIKDASGYVSHRTEVPLAHEIGATEEVRIRDLSGLLSRLEEEGIYPIARIVIVKDPLLIAARPDLAVQDTAGGVWIDSSNIIWVNAFDRTVWDYHVDLAREVAEMGFPEIQWDYVRFPDAPRADLERAVFAGSDGRTKAQGIRAFLRYARAELAELGVLSTADVFGVTTSSARDVGIGQVWESFIDVVDAALPMVYPSHYWQGSFGIQTPNAYPYEIVNRALRDAVRRSNAVDGAGVTRPYLQDFTLGPPSYGAPEVRAQIEAAYDAGIDEWVLWNPGSRYTEGALEPVGGFEEEPLMRVAGGVYPVSRRQIVIDSVRAVRIEAEARAQVLRDSLSTVRDSLESLPPVVPVPADTAGVQSGGTPGDAPADTARVSGP
ncbi:MAG: putative glycoside hydrolase [Gemmatimonadota bacterium]